jgi:hypothetical protein
LIPLYDSLVDIWLEDIIALANNLGNQFWAPEQLVQRFVNHVIDVYQGYKDRDVVFAGINTGGLFAKAAGMLVHRQGVSFLSFPAFNDFFRAALRFSKDDAWYIINVHNYEGIFTKQEPDIAVNLGIQWVPQESFWDFTVFRTFARDTVYQSFCTVAAKCGQMDKFKEYCTAAVGELAVDSIQNYVEEWDGLPRV